MKINRKIKYIVFFLERFVKDRLIMINLNVQYEEAIAGSSMDQCITRQAINSINRCVDQTSYV